MSLQALEVALSPMLCWIHGPTPQNFCPASALHPLLIPTDCPPGSASSVGTQALLLPGVVCLSSNAACCDYPAVDNGHSSVGHTG